MPTTEIETIVSHTADFRPRRFLNNGHLQTIAGNYLARVNELPAPEVQLVEVSPATANQIASQVLCHCHWQPGEVRTARPTAIIVHGLEGSCDSNYVLGIAEKAYQCGFHVVRLNQRNCGDSEKLTPTLYNSGMSADYRAVLEELADGDGFTQIFFAGYSMGGNLITKMAGEYGDAPPRALRGICAICPAMDLASCADALNKRENYFYQRHFVKGLMARYARKAALFPKIYSRDGFDKIRSVRGFDDAITAPCFGYRDAQEYYETASARRVVGNVRVPMLMITAQDDPFVPYESFLAALVADNPAIHFVAPERGGHCAFISKHPGRERFWAEARVVDFCDGLRV